MIKEDKCGLTEKTANILMWKVRTNFVLFHLVTDKRLCTLSFYVYIRYRQNSTFGYLRKKNDGLYIEHWVDKLV